MSGSQSEGDHPEGVVRRRKTSHLCEVLLLFPDFVGVPSSYFILFFFLESLATSKPTTKTHGQSKSAVSAKRRLGELAGFV